MGRHTDVDLDGDGDLDAVSLDFDGDGRPTTRSPTSTATGSPIMPCSTCDGSAELLHRRRLRHLDDRRRPPGTAGPRCAGSASTASSTPAARWPTSTATGRPTIRLLDSDGNGLADRVLSAGQTGVTGYVDTDGDGRWDVKLSDTDGDGTADAASVLAPNVGSRSLRRPDL